MLEVRPVGIRRRALETEGTRARIIATTADLMEAQSYQQVAEELRSLLEGKAETQ